MPVEQFSLHFNSYNTKLCADKLLHASCCKIISLFCQTNDANLRETHSKCEHGTQIARIEPYTTRPCWYNDVVKWNFVCYTKCLHFYNNFVFGLLKNINNGWWRMLWYTSSLKVMVYSLRDCKLSQHLCSM